MSRAPARSACPISCALDVLGDKWTLVVLRDLLFAGKRSFAEFASAEGIASNVLSERLARLETAGVLTRSPDPDDRRRRRYTPTERGWALAPVLLELSIWGKDHCGATAKGELVEWARRDRAGLIAAMMGGTLRP